MNTATLEQTKSSAPSAAATSIALAFDSAIKQNSLVIVGVSYNHTTATNISSITDTRGNTYTRINGTTNAADRAVEMWYAYRTTGGACTVTVNFSSSVTHALVIREYSGLRYDVTPFQTTAANTTTGTSHSSGTMPRWGKAITLQVVVGGTNHDGNELSAGSLFVNFSRVGDGTTMMEVAIEDRNHNSTNTTAGSMLTGVSVSTGVIGATFMVDFPNALKRQEATFSDSSSGTTKNIGLSNNCMDHSLLVLVAMDSHTAINNISSITDTAGNTWQRAEANSSGGGINGEVWYAYNCRGGFAPTLTVTYANACTVAMILREYSGVRYSANPLDVSLSAVDSVSAYAQNTGTRTSTYQLVLAALAWNSATLSATASTLFTDATQVHNATSNNRAAVSERDAPTASNQGASWTTTSNTTTVVMTVSFHLEMLQTTTTEDGYVQKAGDGVGGYLNYVDTTDLVYSYTTSSSAVDPTNTNSAKTFGYWFFNYPDLPPGAIITRLRFHYSVFDAFSDGLSNGWYIYTDNTGALGTTLDTGDWDGISTNVQDVGFAPATLGWNHVDLTPAEFTNKAQPLVIMMEHQTGSLTSTYTAIASREVNFQAAFLEVSYKLPLLPGQGVG